MRNCGVEIVLHLKNGNAVKVYFSCLVGDLCLEIKLELNPHFVCLLGKWCYFHNSLISF